MRLSLVVVLELVEVTMVLIIQQHYRKPYVCRVPHSLPWVKPRAHGKRCVTRSGAWQRGRLPCASTKDPRQSISTRQRKDLCRVPNFGHMTKMTARDVICPIVTFAVCHNKALSKVSSCCVLYFGHTAKIFQNNCILPPQIFWYKYRVHVTAC